MENSWYLEAHGDNVALSVTHPGSTGTKHVVTGLYAGYNDAATDGVVTVTVGGVARITLYFTGQIALNGLNLEFNNSIGASVGATLTASGVAGNFGSVLLNGYTK